MNGYVLLMIPIILTAFYLFYETRRVKRNARSNRQEERRTRHEEYMKTMMGKKSLTVSSRNIKGQSNLEDPEYNQANNGAIKDNIDNG